MTNPKRGVFAVMALAAVLAGGAERPSGRNELPFSRGPRFGSPNAKVTSSLFGIVSSQTNAPSQTQIGLKLL